MKHRRISDVVFHVEQLVFRANPNPILKEDPDFKNAGTRVAKRKDAVGLVGPEIPDEVPDQYSQPCESLAQTNPAAFTSETGLFLYEILSTMLSLPRPSIQPKSFLSHPGISLSIT